MKGFERSENLPAGNLLTNKMEDFYKILVSYRVIILYFLSFFLYFMTGCIFYYYEEGWGIDWTLSFTVVTVATVGYGYRVPTTDRSRLFTIFYMLIGIYFIFYAVSSFISSRFAAATEYMKNKLKSNADATSQLKYHQRVLIYIAITIIVTTFLGAAIFQAIEGWTFITALYFTVQTATTVGYGDIIITHEKRTRIFIGFYIVFSTILFAFAFNAFTMYEQDKQLIVKTETMLHKQKHLEFISNLDTGNGVSEEKFLLAILEHLEIIDFEKDLKPWKEKFSHLDIGKTGKLHRRELIIFSENEAENAEESIQKINAAIESFPPLISPRGSLLARGSFRNSDVMSPMIRQSIKSTEKRQDESYI